MRIPHVLSLVTFTLAALPLSLPAQTQGSGNGNNTQLQSGPVVPGVCFLSREATIVNAKVGQAASARLKQLSDQAQAAIDAERKPIDAEVKTYQAQAASLSAPERQSREQALAQKLQTLQADQDRRARELDATRVKAMNQIAQYAQPVIESVYKSKSCGLLLDRGAVMGGNMSNDLTAAVVQGLDAKVTTISFNLETLPANSNKQ